MTAPLPLREDAMTLTDGRTLGWAEYGDPHGRPVLLFHGTPGARRQVAPDSGRAAAERGLRLISIERPGAGWSTPHLYGAVRDWARDVAQFTERLGLARFACIGLSGGGPYTLACAHELADRIPVVAVLGGLGPTSGPEAAPGYTRLLGHLHPLLRTVARPGSWALAKLLGVAAPAAPLVGPHLHHLFPKSDRPVLQDPRNLEVLIDSIMAGLEGDFRAPFYDLVLFGRDWGFALSDIEVPVHFWAGEQDAIVPTCHATHQAKLIKNAKVVYKPGEGHFAGYTEMAVVMDAIVAAWPRSRPSLWASSAPA